MYETFEHTADLGLRVRASTLDGLFAEAAQGLFSMIVPELASVLERQEVTIALTGPAIELLLLDWLSELLYTFESQHLLLSQFSVRIEGEQLTAIARGETIDPARHVLDHEVKAITYHGLKLEPSADGWFAEVIVDI